MVIQYSRRVFFAPNTSDQELIAKAKKTLSYHGIDEDDVQINHNINELEEGDIYIIYDPPYFIIISLYQKKIILIINIKII